MIRFIRTEEIDTVLGWHFRNVDKLPGGREKYALKFPNEYRHVIDTITGMSGFVLVTEEDGQLSGYIGVRIDETSAHTRAYLCGFYVVPQKRRSGYGRVLAESVIKAMQERGIASLSVEVGLQRPWLIKFYESVGFLQSSVNMYQEFEGSPDL